MFHGVLMRSDGKTAVALRNGDGTLTVAYKTYKNTSKKIDKIPLLRGIVNLIGSVAASLRTADRSFRKTLKLALYVVIYLAVALGMGFLIDYLLENLIFTHYISENLCWAGLFLSELALAAVVLRHIPMIRRLFGYHAAEHMTIACYEQNKELTLDNVRNCSRIHPRCGTNLATNAILLVLLFEIFLPPMQNSFLYYTVDTLGTLLLFGIAYEAMRYAEKHTNRLSRMINAAGELVQRIITTVPPTDKQLECGIAALEEVLRS